MRERKKNNLNIFVVATVAIGILFAITLLNNLQSSSRVTFTESEQIAPHYVEYSEGALARAQKKGRAVVYFWAVWCPTCQALDKELKVRSQELPDDVTILKTNYDTEKELKEKYQIIQQHTLVQVDKNGNEVKKWIGGNIDVVKQELK